MGKGSDSYVKECGLQSSKRLDAVISTSHLGRFLASQAQPLLEAKGGGEDGLAEGGRKREELNQSCSLKLEWVVRNFSEIPKEEGDGLKGERNKVIWVKLETSMRDLPLGFW